MHGSCLSCDKHIDEKPYHGNQTDGKKSPRNQIDNGGYCSQYCRLADLELVTNDFAPSSATSATVNVLGHFNLSNNNDAKLLCDFTASFVTKFGPRRTLVVAIQAFGNDKNFLCNNLLEQR